ncbi:MAG TPA: bifunctional folylpolyglutamate synthase/dihydrofolate synthase [Treponema sp.]|nr:bifunctional folylpolyglutamate synthase/dihydrofolate synthase [Treponema sp.]
MSSAAIGSFLAWADHYLNFEKLPQKNIFWLDTMSFLCERLGHPERCCPCFHIAGSKGKGSVSSMIASVLAEAGYSVGLYQSPHILDFRERVRTPGGFFPEDVYERAAAELKAAVAAVPPEDFPGGRPLTWFEIVTVFAMLCFRIAGVDYAVYEVGLGGRLDATNVVRPLCSCITPIELEHTEYLGSTVEAIAAEKAGIIKDGIPVISAPQPQSVRDVFRKTAEKHAAALHFSDCDVRLTIARLAEAGLPDGRQLQTERPVTMAVTLESPLFRHAIQTNIRLLGSFQGENAAVAALAVRTALPDIPEECIASGLAEAYLPGRFEIVRHSGAFPHIPELIFDGAHTKNSVQMTMETFRSLYGNQSAHLLFACAADKDVEDIALCLRGSFTNVTLTRPGSIKAADMPRMQRAFAAAGVAFSAEEDCRAAIAAALAAADKAAAPLLVTGSFYLVAEAKEFLRGSKALR